VKRLWKLLRVLFRQPRRLRPVEVDLRLRKYAAARKMRLRRYRRAWRRKWAEQKQAAANAAAKERRDRFTAVSQ
jgi:hypothetical protein